jgi:hypothetical protein
MTNFMAGQSFGKIKNNPPNDGTKPGTRKKCGLFAGVAS